MKLRQTQNKTAGLEKASGDPYDLALQIHLQRDLKGIASLERLLHVTLRLIANRFGAEHAVMISHDRHGAPVIEHQLGAEPWDLEAGRQLLSNERPPLEATTLYSILKENEKTVAVLMMRREHPFERGDLRALQRLSEIVNEALANLATARVREVLARIDRKISQQLQTKDLLYQILEGLRLLIRYDHSASILLLDTEHSQLVVRAEKITWRKKKSNHIHDIVSFGPDMAEAFSMEGRAALLDVSSDGVATTLYPLWETGSDDTRPEDSLEDKLQSLYPRLCYNRQPGNGPRENSMLVAPLLFGTRLLGLLKLSSQHAGMFTESDVLVVGQFIEKMATAIRNANLYERRLDELHAINEIGKLVTRQLPIEETCERILDIVLQVMNLKVGSVELLDTEHERLRFLASRGYPLADEGLVLGEGITGEVARTNQPIVANDVTGEPHYVARFADVRSELAVPIAFEGVCRGVLNVESYSRNRFQQRDVDFLSILADKTATALETLGQRDHRRATLKLLYELSAKLAVPEGVQALADLTTKLTRQHLHCEAASLFLFDDGFFRRAASSGVPSTWFPDEKFRTGEGLTGKAAVLRQGAVPSPIIDNHVGDSGLALPSILQRYQEIIGTGSIAHLIAVPLIEAGQPIGILRVINRLTQDGRLLASGFNTTDITIIQTIASQVSIALANSRKRQRIQQMSQRLEAQVLDRTAEVHRLALFVEKAPVAIFSIDHAGALDFINETGGRMFGCAPAELVGRSVDVAGSGILGDSIHDIENVVDYMSNWSGELEAHRVNGETFPALLSVQRMAATDGTPQGLIVFARDISAMKELEKQLVASEGKRAMADLAGGVAHDLNNALGSSLPLIQALKSDIEEGKMDQQQFLDDLRQIESYTRLSVRIFKGMLNMARGTFAIDQEVVVNEPLAIAIDLLGFRFDKTNIEVVRDLGEDIPKMLAHPGRLEQAFHNLISNSIDAMPDGGTLTLRTYHKNKSIYVEILDSGVGIKKSLLSRVEEPFYTSKRHGTGLGLSVVRSIVWEHNGKMHLASKVNQGTTVTLEFPATHQKPLRKIAQPEHPTKEP